MFLRACLAFLLSGAAVAGQEGSIVLTADERGAATTLPRPWAGAIEGGALADGLRTAWQEALRTSAAECGFGAVRLNDVFAPALRVSQGYVYVDDVLDRMAALNLRPYLELPARPVELTALAHHLAERYNITDLRLWRFEIEAPDAEAYAAAAAAMRKVDAQLEVGLRLPSAELPALDSWLEALRRRSAPLDFLTVIPQGAQTAAACANAAGQLRAGGYPRASLRVAGWSSSRVCPDFAHDELPLAVYVLETNLELPASIQGLAYWRMCDALEDPGPLRGILRGGPGLVTFQGIVKPAYHAYRYLNALGEDVLLSVPGGVVTRRHQSGRLVVLAYNYPAEAPRVPPVAATLADAERLTASGSARTVSITLTGLQPGGQILIEWVDPQHGNAAQAWREMGSPESPGRQALDSLRTAARASVVEYRQADDAGHFTDSRSLAPWGMLLLREL